MEVDINFWGVLFAGISAMIVGAVWYADGVFGKQWKKLANIDEKKAKEQSPQALISMFVVALISAYVLAHVTYLSSQFFSTTSYLSSALSSSFWMWLGFVVYGQVSYALFEMRPRKLIGLNLANSLLTFLVMGFVIGTIGI
jgi:accessory gene regulator protein AgrB